MRSEPSAGSPRWLMIGAGPAGLGSIAISGSINAEAEYLKEQRERQPQIDALLLTR